MKKPLSNYINIIYLEADIDYTIVHFQDGSKQIFSYTLKKYQDLFSSLNAFSRIHRRYLVNREFITSCTETEVYLSCGKRLPLARRRSL